MKRVVFSFIEGIDPPRMNLQGDYIDRRDDFIFVWNGEDIVAIVRPELVNMVCISEKKEDAKTSN